jgi:hypothetical protein
VQHEGICIGAELGNDEGHLVSHEAADEMHVAAAGTAALRCSKPSIP